MLSFKNNSGQQSSSYIWDVNIVSFLVLFEIKTYCQQPYYNSLSNYNFMVDGDDKLVFYILQHYLGHIETTEGW